MIVWILPLAIYIHFTFHSASNADSTALSIALELLIAAIHQVLPRSLLACEILGIVGWLSSSPAVLVWCCCFGHYILPGKQCLQGYNQNHPIPAALVVTIDVSACQQLSLPQMHPVSGHSCGQIRKQVCSKILILKMIREWILKGCKLVKKEETLLCIDWILWVNMWNLFCVCLAFN